jgi:sugar/nucleoside kinase (ribokinase family)
MPSNQAELRTLKNLLSQIDRILATAPELPENRTASCRELLAAALALTGDLLKQPNPSTAAVTLGRKGGSTTSRRHGPEHYRQMAAQRKTHGGGRPRKESD